jgi:hypothetical protein
VRIPTVRIGEAPARLVRVRSVIHGSLRGAAGVLGRQPCILKVRDALGGARLLQQCEHRCSGDHHVCSRRRNRFLKCLIKGFLECHSEDSTLSWPLRSAPFQARLTGRTASHNVATLTRVRPPAAHGTTARWNNGCSCGECRRAHSEREKARKRALARKRLPIGVRQQLLDAIYDGQPSGRPPARHKRRLPARLCSQRVPEHQRIRMARMH